MISDNWMVIDPDGILTRTEDEVTSMEFNGFICNEIIPREDLFQAKNKNTGVIVDLGYYEYDSSKNGKWIINVIGSNLDWHNPLERKEFLSLGEALIILKKLLIEYDS